MRAKWSEVDEAIREAREMVKAGGAMSDWKEVLRDCIRLDLNRLYEIVMLENPPRPEEMAEISEGIIDLAIRAASRGERKLVRARRENHERFER